MKSLNAKRIAAVVTGAALLGMGLAFAGQVTFSSVQVISQAGTPLMQVVVGSSAKPIDAVSAGNIAAAIGNLAYTSVPVTATVNQSSVSKLKVAVTSSSYTLTNQQVWLNVSGGVGGGAGTYTFTTLIGSVINEGVILSAPQNTKSLQGGSGTQYAHQELGSITTSPVASAYTFVGFVPTGLTPSANSNGGGLTFTSFQSLTGGTFDNVMRITPSQLPTLTNNWGANGESAFLWVSGFPVFDQASGVNNFQTFSLGGAWQAVFSKPIQNVGTGLASKQLNTPVLILGQNWTILKANSMISGTLTVGGTSNVVNGGQIQLASSLSPLQTVYVGKNVSGVPAPWVVTLQDLGQSNSNGVSPASLGIWYNGVPTNTSSVYPGTTAKFNVTGKTLFVNVNATFAGLYAYQKWAKLQVYSNVFNVTDGKVFNQTTNPGWYAKLWWTNTTGSGNAVALYSIILYNTTPVQASPGGSFTFIQSPAVYKITFFGDTLGSGSFDPLVFTSSTVGSVQYQNLGTSGGPGLSISNVTEAAQELTVASSIPNAFSYAGQTSGSVTLNLLPFQLNENANVANAVVFPWNGVFGNGALIGGENVVVTYTVPNGANWISSTNPLTVIISGFTSNTGGFTQKTATINGNFPAAANQFSLGANAVFYNITGIQLYRALPGAITVNVIATNAVNPSVTFNNLAYATGVGNGGVFYPLTGKVYQALSTSAAGNIIYNQYSGQPTTAMALSAPITPTGLSGQQQFFTFTINEIAVPTNTAAQDQLIFGIDNSTAGVAATPMFQMNYSVAPSTSTTGSKNNMTYQPTSGSAINNYVTTGFRTERGSKIASITPTVETINIAKAVDTLAFTVGPAGTGGGGGKRYTLYGPFGVGQPVTGVPGITNTSIGPVTANVALSGTSGYTITGTANLTATASVPSATTPVLLKSLGTSPLVILDSQASAGSSLILVGSGYVNTLSQVLQSSYNVSITPSSAPIAQAYGNKILVAGYTGNQTWSAAQSFIAALYAQAH